MKSKILTISLVCICLLFSCAPDLDIEGNENAELIRYNGEEYRSGEFYCARDDRKLIGRLRGSFGADVYAVGSGEYIEIVGDDNSGFFIKKGSSVPTSGTVTKILIDPAIRGDNSLYLSSDDELSMIEELTKLTGAYQKFTVANYYTDGNYFYYVYNNSNVSCRQNYGGYVAYTDGKWIFSSAKAEPVENGNANAATISAIVIEDQALIEKMCKTDLVKYIEYK